MPRKWINTTIKAQIGWPWHKDPPSYEEFMSSWWRSMGADDRAITRLKETIRITDSHKS